MRRPLVVRLFRINAQVWLLLSVFIISAVFNTSFAPHHVVMGLYLLPTLFAAFYGGRLHALLTTVATVVLVYSLTHIKPALFAPAVGSTRTHVDVLAWCGLMLLIAYIVGTLVEHRKRYVRELREAYHGVLLILSHLLSQDTYTESHSYRVALYASVVATDLRMSEDDIEDIRAAALLHDIGKLQVSRELLYKAARLTDPEYQQVMQHVNRGAELLSAAGGSLRRIIPIVLAHHEKFDGSGPNQLSGSGIPPAARVIAVADVYDSLISDRPYRKAMAPIAAKEAIEKGSGTDFDPKVVAAFVRSFQQGRLDSVALARS